MKTAGKYLGIIGKMADAIQTFEGWNLGSVSYNNNNPGNLKFANQPFAVLGDRGFAHFNTYQHGYNALINLLTNAFMGKSSIYSPTMSLYDFFAIYSEDNQAAYAEYVASQLGVDPNTELQDLA